MDSVRKKMKMPFLWRKDNVTFVLSISVFISIQTKASMFLFGLRNGTQKQARTPYHSICVIWSWLTMADRLTGSQRSDLAARISAQTWNKIAVAYLELEDGFLSSLKVKHREDVEAQNQEIISTWANKNSFDQVKVCVICAISLENINRRVLLKKGVNYFFRKSMVNCKFFKTENIYSGIIADKTIRVLSITLGARSPAWVTLKWVTLLSSLFTGIAPVLLCHRTLIFTPRVGSSPVTW